VSETESNAESKAVSDRPLWHLKFEDKKYVFDPREHLTVGALRQIKHWYGAELGRYLSFISAFSQGDPEAALCALWLVRKAAGEENVPEPEQMPNFAMGDFYDFFQAAGSEDPTQAQAADPATPVSTGTQRSSGIDTSGS
jgi:hypothetical protein